MATEAFVNILGLAQLTALIGNYGRHIFRSDRLKEEIAQYAMFKIKTRTLAGVDADHTRFADYSEGYRFFRRKAGRPTERVDLFFTGSMLSAITSDIHGDQVKLYFLNTTDRRGTRNPLKAYFLNETRNFFALSEEDIQGIVRIVERFISEI